MAIVAEGNRGRLYISPTEEHIEKASQAVPNWRPEASLPQNPRNFNTPIYGIDTYDKLFTPRQLVALTTFSDLVQEVRQRVLADAAAAGLPDDARPLHAGGCGTLAYADAVATYMAIAVDKGADYWSSICSWHSGRDTIRNTFACQAMPMVWDFAEANPMSDSTGNFQGAVDWVADVIEEVPCEVGGFVNQRDATASINGVTRPLISTDPPYYDNIGYADLSDFFYVWLRRSLAGIYPDIFRTMLVPKKEELVATPYRFEGSKSKAQEFFETGLGHAFERMRAVQHPNYPLTVYYAFKQSESEAGDSEEGGNGQSDAAVASTGWETMLEGLIRAGFEITGTWPMRTEMMNRSVGLGANALASSIVLVCRPRPVDAPIATRREFLLALKRELPEKLRILQHGSIAPVDLAQASIGPGMSIYSRYSKVVESDGTPLRVRTALQMINQELDAALAEQEGEYENETRWAVAWFEQYGMQEGEYGVAETLSKAKNMSVAHLEEMGLVASQAGKVRLRKREELRETWTPRESTVWEVTQRLIHTLLEDKSGQGGEGGAANILRQVFSLSESVRDLTYRLYTVCERQSWAQEALAYNALITSWPQISALAHTGQPAIQQESLFEAS
jgi:putative DNA methylase